jgi:hypothetical protein
MRLTRASSSLHHTPTVILPIRIGTAVSIELATRVIARHILIITPGEACCGFFAGLDPHNTGIRRIV